MTDRPRHAASTKLLHSAPPRRAVTHYGASPPAHPRDAMRYPLTLPTLPALVLLVLTGCQSMRSPAPTLPSLPPAPPPVERPAPPAPPTGNAATRAAATQARLATEKARLAGLFRGTPVVFDLLPDGSMRVDVPTAFAFDPGKAVVKPPLAAVLDRIATGQQRELTRIVIGAPADTAAQGAALARERAASARDYCVARGLPPDRVVAAVNGASATVRITVSAAPAP